MTFTKYRNQVLCEFCARSVWGRSSFVQFCLDTVCSVWFRYVRSSIFGVVCLVLLCSVQQFVVFCLGSVCSVWFRYIRAPEVVIGSFNSVQCLSGVCLGMVWVLSANEVIKPVNQIRSVLSRIQFGGFCARSARKSVRCDCSISWFN